MLDSLRATHLLLSWIEDEGALTLGYSEEGEKAAVEAVLRALRGKRTMSRAVEIGKSAYREWVERSAP